MNFRNFVRAGLFAALAGACAMAPAIAAEAGVGDQAVRARISEVVKRVNPDLEVGDISRTPVNGIREVVINGQILYFTEDGRYMLQGELVDMGKGVSLTEQRREAVRAGVLSQLTDDDFLVYPAKGERKHSITVVTDIDCPYCRKFHQHMDEMNGLGIEVRYLLMPRAGVASPSYVKAVNVWCAENPREAMTAAKQGKPVPTKTCDHPVDRHMAIAQQMGVNATPTSITGSGNVLPGYMAPKELLAKLEAGGKRADQ